MYLSSRSFTFVRPKRYGSWEKLHISAQYLLLGLRKLYHWKCITPINKGNFTSVNFYNRIMEYNANVWLTLQEFQQTKVQSMIKVVKY